LTCVTRASRDARDNAPMQPKLALWQLGFRPFYLLASIFAALSIPLWIAQYAGLLAPYPGGMLSHAHEMLFGYALAVIAGFLFTAGRNWSGQPTPTGWALAALALLWVVARVLAFTPWSTAAAVASAAFPLGVAAGLAVALVKGGNRRNYFFVALLAAFAIAAITLHLSYVGILEWPERLSLLAGLDLVLFVIAVMGGRVIPMFTNNGVPGTRATRNAIVERVALGSVLVLVAADVIQAPPLAVAVVATVGAIAHAIRLMLWQPWRTTRVPMVWVLHASYAWIVVYLALRAAAALELVPSPFAVHALTIGAIGGMTLGMMTRTARGHTGRPLIADRYEVASFLLVQAAAIVRVFVGLMLPQFYVATVVVSGVCWSLAFAIYAVRYWPILTRSRLDGKAG
jgi:uncharacterized protein involved in response to NO